MRKCPIPDHYKYIVTTYIDDLPTILKDPKALIDQLTSIPYNFQVEKILTSKFPSSWIWFKLNSTDTCMDPGKYVDQMEEACIQHFKTELVQKHRFPLQKGDHPELDTTPFLYDDKKEAYQSLLGSSW